MWSVGKATVISTLRGSGIRAVARLWTNRGRFALADPFNGTGRQRAAAVRHAVAVAAPAAAGTPVAQAENR